MHATICVLSSQTKCLTKVNLGRIALDCGLIKKQTHEFYPKFVLDPRSLMEEKKNTLGCRWPHGSLSFTLRTKKEKEISIQVFPWGWMSLKSLGIKSKPIRTDAESERNSAHVISLVHLPHTKVQFWGLLTLSIKGNRPHPQLRCGCFTQQNQPKAALKLA